MIEAIGVTDYYVTETYQRVLEHKQAGRLQSASLLFPNVELRLDAGTKGGFVNMHLLVSPEDADHVVKLQLFLSRLHFTVQDDRFDCRRAELIRLGRTMNQALTDERAALAFGAKQFKVNFRELREVFNESEWAKANILIAVAGGTNDGTSGVKGAADQALRQEIERFADVIFASSAAQREFWLGEGILSAKKIRERYRGLKPCLHGSDAHGPSHVGRPFGDRFSWIKGGVEFDSLRQACIVPQGRAHVGAEPPSSATPSQVIAQVETEDAHWMQTPVVPLNPGLVAIIGARGSGKTALADIIAAGCDSIREEALDRGEGASPSFLARARSLVGDASVKVTWASGDQSTRSLDDSDAKDPASYPRVRYLSQQFVENLCSSTGMTDELLREIERVVYEAQPEDDRDGALNFAELLENRASRHRFARQREVEAVSDISERIGVELEKDNLVASLEAEVSKKKKLVDAYTADRAKLVSAGSEERVKRHTMLAEAANKVIHQVRGLANQRKTFLALQDEVEDLRSNKAPEALRQTQARHAHSGMSDNQWAAFLLVYKGNVDDDLAGYIEWVDGVIASLKGVAPTPGDTSAPFIADDANLSAITLAVLEAEMARLEKLVSVDRETQRRYSTLSSRIASETAALQTLTAKLEDSKGAKNRVRGLQIEREKAYGRAFDALIAEQAVLEDMYEPLRSRLAAADGTLKKLSFTVARFANVDEWAIQAEEGLIDLRKQGAFRGKGTLLQKTNEMLRPAWETGTASAIVAAMTKFRRQYQKHLLDHSPMAHSERTEFRGWLKRFAQWLFSTDHIGIQYGIEYDGVDIARLSPGTRGIVLLLLYLALDNSDGRPLVIDQPEENLDPKSVFDELVDLFVETKSNRQVIMVTHNANLVVNTDADQVIVAEVGSHPPGSLPPITYTSGGLDQAEIRKAVCDILEGGEGAFQERARRLRVSLAR